MNEFILSFAIFTLDACLGKKIKFGLYLYLLNLVLINGLGNFVN